MQRLRYSDVCIFIFYKGTKKGCEKNIIRFCAEHQVDLGR